MVQNSFNISYSYAAVHVYTNFFRKISKSCNIVGLKNFVLEVSKISLFVLLKILIWPWGLYFVAKWFEKFIIFLNIFYKSYLWLKIVFDFNGTGEESTKDFEA